MSTSRRAFLHLVGASGAGIALGGCEDALVGLIDPRVGADFAPPTHDVIDPVTHVLNRLTWGPAPGEYARVRGIGVDAFVAEQLHPERIRDLRCDLKVAPVEAFAAPTAELYEYNEQELLAGMTSYKLLRGVYSRRQLYEVMVDFWSDHFNIASAKGDCRWLKMADDRDVIRAGALGSFRSLVEASALSPAMLIYLDGHANRVERPEDRPNENYARELLELHTMGVDGGYSQTDVMEVARCLSGYTYENRPFAFKAARVAFDPSRHDDGAKRILGHEIAAGGGAADLQRVLDIVCSHPATARYIATKLCRRFIADPAPDAAVREVAATFTRTDGDIRATLASLFATDAFASARGGLLKRPLRFVLSTLRATGAKTNGGPALAEYLERMGHAPFQYPTPDGYPIEEAPWLGTLLWRWNFALAIAGEGFAGTTLDASRLEADFGGIDALAAHLLGRKPNPIETEVIAQSANPIALLLSTPAFQIH